MNRYVGLERTCRATGALTAERGGVNTVLGPVPGHELGVVAVHETLLSVVPGAEFAFDITIDRAEVVEILAAKLREFRERGGGTIVDAAGMFHGRDVMLYEDLSRSTGVHIVASTGMGPEEMLGGYFRSSRADSPTSPTAVMSPMSPMSPKSPKSWPGGRFADLFAKEVTGGMVVPRVERRGAAGLVATAVTAAGMTATDESLLRGAARTALNTGVPVSVRYGADAVGELKVLLGEGLGAGRVVVGGLDRTVAVATGAPFEVARRGAYVALDHVGVADHAYLTDAERVGLVAGLVEAGFGDRILLSSNATGKAVGHRGNDLPYGYVLSSFVPLLTARGLGDEDVRRILVDNPRELLSVH